MKVEGKSNEDAGPKLVSGEKKRGVRISGPRTAQTTLFKSYSQLPFTFAWPLFP